jgi:hypothetical protein
MQNTTIGIYDFNAAPYALGDVATWIENVAITANEAGSESTEIFILTGPDQKNQEQSYIVDYQNYSYHFGELFPIFLFTKDLAKIHIYDGPHRLVGMARLFSLLEQKKNENTMVRTWPSLDDTIRKKWVYSSHSLINTFYEKNRIIPRLSVPPGCFDRIVPRILPKGKDRILVSVNIRQRKNYTNYLDSSVDLTRDSPVREWYDFFAYNKKNNPDCVFLILGGYSEWDNRLCRFGNVIIPRTQGMNLFDEILILLNSDLFIGSSSGFAQIATFSTVPYIITNMQPRAVHDGEIPYGARKYPFALDDQYIFWGVEDQELVARFETVLASVRKKRS